MKTIHSMIVVAVLAFTLPAQAAVGDPEQILYRITGVDSTGLATAFNCTPFSGVTETVRVVVRDQNGNVLKNAANQINHLSTRSFSSDPGGSVGTAAIAATSNQVVCAAFVGSSVLHMLRFNPIAGTTE